MTDLLDQITRNPAAAILLAIVALILAGILAGIINGFFKFCNAALCAFTGKYPPPRPVVKCDCDDSPCFCCRDSDCDEGCKCYEEREDRE